MDLENKINRDMGRIIKDKLWDCRPNLVDIGVCEKVCDLVDEVVFFPVFDSIFETMRDALKHSTQNYGFTR
jgi:hypothetical protein